MTSLLIKSHLVGKTSLSCFTRLPILTRVRIYFLMCSIVVVVQMAGRKPEECLLHFSEIILPLFSHCRAISMKTKAMCLLPRKLKLRARKRGRARKECMCGRYFAFFSNLIVNLDWSRMNLMIFGIFDHFLFKQILSLDSEMILRLWNALDSSVCFVLFSLV